MIFNVQSLRKRFQSGRPTPRSAACRTRRAKRLRLETLEARQLLAGDWLFGLGATGEMATHELSMDALGNTFVAGRFSGTVDFDPGPGTAYLTSTLGDDARLTLDGFLAKYDLAGNLAWVRHVVRDTGYGTCDGIALDTQGNIYVTGRLADAAQVGTASFAADACYDGYVAKYDAQGAFCWAQWFRDDLFGHYVRTEKIDTDAAGNIYVAGHMTDELYSGPSGAGTLLLSTVWPASFVLKLEPTAGNVEWAWKTGGAAASDPSEILVGPDGYIYLGGAVRGTESFGSHVLNVRGCVDAYAAKLDPNTAEVLWARRMGGESSVCYSADEGVNGLAVGGNGDLYLAGGYVGTADFGTYTLGLPDEKASYVSRLNTDTGDVEWAQSVSYYSTNDGVSEGGIIQDMTFAPGVGTAPDGVLVTGYFNVPVDFDTGDRVAALDPGGNTDGYIWMLQVDGQFERVWQIASDSSAVGQQLATDGNTIHLAGRYRGQTAFPVGSLNSSVSDTFLMSFSPPPPTSGQPAAADAYTCWRNYSISIPAMQGVLLNDYSANGYSLTAALVAGPANGSLTLAADGSFQYIPNLEFIGTDTFTYLADDGHGGTAQATASIQVNPLPTSVTYSCSSTGPLTDMGTTRITMTAADLFEIADLNVTLNINHQRDEDLDVFLISPAGTRVELFTDVGGRGQNFIGTTLDDEAAKSITLGKAPFTGSFRPERPLSAFDGQLIAGTWTLEITDDKKKMTGSLATNCWSLVVTPAAVPSWRTSAANLLVTDATLRTDPLTAFYVDLAIEDLATAQARAQQRKLPLREMAVDDLLALMQ